ncbi:MAG: hypothetical protein IT405_00980 [Candidatus Yanofskybacteria bacterium]|nr:hypothetical protein [Candidatus Yanofskybacteria bacterium]
MNDTMKKAGVIAVVIVVAVVAWRWMRSDDTQRLPSPTPMPAVSGSKAPTSARPTASRTAAPQATTLTGDSAAILSSINSARIDVGAGALAAQKLLQQAAQAHAEDLATSGTLSHANSLGVAFSDRLSAVGYSAAYSAENLGVTSGNAATDVIATWMRSPEQRENMNDPRYKAAGIGVARGKYQGQTAYFVVAIFGSTK